MVGAPFCSAGVTVCFISQSRTLIHRVVAYDAIVQNNVSIVAVQRAFHRHFNLRRNQTVPARNTILRWVEALRTQESLINKRPPGAPRTVRTPENVKRVRQAILRSPGRSAAELQNGHCAKIERSRLCTAIEFRTRNGSHS